MSGILLDTNALLWLLADDPRLGEVSRQRLATASPVCFSAVSALEVTIKQMLGKLELPGDLASAAGQAGLVEVAFSAPHATGLTDLPGLARHDPFDRMLLSQAQAGGLALLTSDRWLLDLGFDWVIDARA